MAFIFPEDKTDFKAPNGVTYSWDGTKWVTKTFKADESALEGYATEVWTEEKIAEAQLDGEVDLSTYATKSYSDANDLALSNRIDAVEGVVSHYQYIIQTANATPRNGELAFLKADMTTTTRWGDVTNIAVNPTSGNGEVWPTDEIVTGDVLRFFLKGDITMEVSAFEAKVVQNNNNLFSIDSVVKEVGTIMDGEEYEVYHLSSFDPSGLATMNYVDAQDATKVSKSGDTMSGPLTVQSSVSLHKEDSTKQFKLSPNNGDYFTNIYAYNGGGMRFRVAPGNVDADYKTAFSVAYVSHTVEGHTHPVETAVNWLRNPTQPHHAANKAYVDANSGGGGAIKLDLWTYKGNKSDGNSLGDGEFASKKLAGGVLELYLGRRNSRGVFYHPTPANSTAEYYHQVTQSSQNGSPMTVMQQDGRCAWFAETKKLIFNKGSANYSVIEAIHYRGAVDLLIEGNQYMLNVPGLLGPVAGW